METVKQHSSKVEERLSELITQHMRTEFASLRMDQTIGEAIEGLRKNPPQGRIIYFYIVDADQHLKGFVPARRLLLNSSNLLVSEIMEEKVISIPDWATVLDACEFFVHHRLLAFPVVDKDKKIIGVVDVELYTDELRDLDEKQKDDDIFQLVGVHLTDGKPSSSVAAFRNRFPWLIANISGGLIAAYLTGFYKTEIEKAVALALFIPVVLALAESVSIQSVSLSLQAIHRRRPTLTSIAAHLKTEAATGALLGMTCAISVASIAMVWLGQTEVVLCLLGGIAGGVTCASMIGVGIPNVLSYFKRDPQVAAGPIALAATDMMTLMIYFNLARWLLQ